MGKAKKLHRKKIQKRNQKIKSEQNRITKIRTEIFKQIMKEQEEGKFKDENLKTLEITDQNTIILDSGVREENT